jgi:hypothetical protein
MTSFPLIRHVSFLGISMDYEASKRRLQFIAEVQNLSRNGKFHASLHCFGAQNTHPSK